MSTTEDLRKDDVIEVRKLHLAAGELSNDELAAVTGGDSIRISVNGVVAIDSPVRVAEHAWATAIETKMSRSASAPESPGAPARSSN